MSGILTAMAIGSAPLSVNVNDGSYGDTQVDPDTAAASFALTNTGLAQGTGESDYPWLLSGAAADYEVFATMVVTGTYFSGPTGSWLNLGTTRTWYQSELIPGNGSTSTFTLEIRRVSGGPVLDMATITLSATITL